MRSSLDLRAEVRRHAAAAGVELPESALAELAAHLEDLHAAALAQGATAAEAHAAAIAAIEESSFSLLRRYESPGSGRLLARRCEPIAGAGDRWSVNMFHAIRFALRQFRMHPSFALLTLLVLGLGTGAATTVFTIVDSVVLRPLPYAQPDRLVALWDTNYEHGLSHDPISPVNFMDYRQLPVWKDAAAWWRPTVNLADPGLEPVRINTIETSANLFEVLGVRPQIGAGFPAGGPLYVSHEHIAVISDRLWRSRYGGAPAVVGRQLKLDGSPYTIVGVMPAKFHYPDDIDVWQRLEWDMSQHSRAAHFMEGVARLADGTSLEQARSACDALASRLQTEFAATNKAWAVRLVPLLDDQLGYYRPALIVLFGAVGLLLLIGCLNVASLLLTRALGREREIAVRIALGAAPRQIATLLIAESGVLSIAGGALGIAMSAIALPLIARLTPVSVPRLEEASVSLATLGVALAVVAFTTAFFGGVPLLALRRARLARDLHSGTRGSSRGARRAYSLLVASQVALAFALLMGSALLVRTVAAMTRTPTGIDADAVVTTSVQLSSADYRDWRQVAEVHARILEQIRLQSGVEAAGSANFLPLEIGWRMPFAIAGQPPPRRPEDEPQAQYHSVSDGYFESLRAPLAAGRAFTAHDTADTAPVVIVNESFAKQFLAGAPGSGRMVVTGAHGIGPLGFNLFASGNYRHARYRFEIVGVVKDIRDTPLGQAVEPALYFPARQFPFREQFLTVRAVNRAAAVGAIHAALAAAAPAVPMGAVRTWGERFAARTAEQRLLRTILVGFGALAALLAALGVYGLVSWSVALRTRELAIRLTLGARPAAVGALVVRQSALLLAIGLAAGLILMRFAGGALARVLFDVSPTDTPSIAVAGALLLAAALAACVRPVTRAMRVDPMAGLRAE